MNKEYKKKSDLLWFSIISAALLFCTIVLLLKVIIENSEYFGIIIILFCSILLLILIRNILRMKSVRITNDEITVKNLWTKKIDFHLSINTITKLVYNTKSGVPWNPLRVTVTKDYQDYEFSVVGFYEEDFIRIFQDKNIPIYKELGDHSQQKLIK